MNHWKVRDGSEKDMEEILSLRKLVFGEEEKDKLRPSILAVGVYEGAGWKRVGLYRGP